MDRLDVAPDGDLILVVSDQLELRVYSCVLRLTSPVFKAMLGPEFAEGQTRGTASRPKRLSLPEDNVMGMRLLCIVLHQINEKLPQSIAPHQLLEFAVSVDKYRCMSAVSLTEQSWFSAYQIATQIDDAILCAAYLLDDAKSFQRLTGIVIESSAVPRHDKKGLGTPTLIDLGASILAGIRDKIKTVEAELRESIGLCVEGISELLRDQYDHYENFSPEESLEDANIYNPHSSVVTTRTSSKSISVPWPSLVSGHDHPGQDLSGR